MSSTKTTITGVIAILVAVLGAVKSLLDGVNVDWSSVIAAVSAGIGLIMARDNSVTSEEAGATEPKV